MPSVSPLWAQQSVIHLYLSLSPHSSIRSHWHGERRTRKVTAVKAGAKQAEDFVAWKHSLLSSTLSGVCFFLAATTGTTSNAPSKWNGDGSLYRYKQRADQNDEIVMFLKKKLKKKKKKKKQKKKLWGLIHQIDDYARKMKWRRIFRKENSKKITNRHCLENTTTYWDGRVGILPTKKMQKCKCFFNSL